ncbi:hypothetical protein AB0H51_28740 [Streptomyces griseoluteus]|uniref:hypothetical protein n=1 Tax=Streptomyces griseoluteus TaxID=29306 RepID=UPI00340DEF36
MDVHSRFTDALRRPGAYGIRTFEQATAFMTGFDAATEWNFLRGFQEWLAQEVDNGENLAWPVLASRLPQDRPSDDLQRCGCGGLEDARLAALFHSLKRFLDIPDD